MKAGRKQMMTELLLNGDSNSQSDDDTLSEGPSSERPGFDAEETGIENLEQLLDKKSQLQPLLFPPFQKQQRRYFGLIVC
jgi:hypothetical protein